jgi:hypothetical protein
MTASTSTDHAPSPTLSDATRVLLEGVRRGLLHLHKALLESERAAYEQVNGRVTPGELLQLLINDAGFSWLRPFSELVIQIDELQEAGKGTKAAQELGTEQEAQTLLEQARLLLKTADKETGSNKQYYEALQDDPATIQAHTELLKLLSVTAPN